jgi:molybdate transport system substrate-binding protein
MGKKAVLLSVSQAVLVLAIAGCAAGPGNKLDPSKGASASSKGTEIRVLSAAAVQIPLTEVIERFERDTGHKVSVEYSTAGGVDTKVKDGRNVNLVISDRKRIESLSAAGFLPKVEPRILGVVQIGVAARAGAPRPDLSSPDAFKGALLKAQSVAYGDPPKGSTTGIHFAKQLEKMGIADAVNAKAVLAANGLEVMKAVAAGKAELGITQISEILHVAPTTLVGPLPDELQLKTSYAAIPGSGSQDEAVVKLVEALTSNLGRERFRHAGFD